MSVLTDKSNIKISWAWLKAQGYWRDGWGDPEFRKTHNTKMYENLMNDDDYRTWHIMYFPKTFEGRVYFNMTPVDVRGRVAVSRNTSGSSYYISPIVKTTQDIEMFIQAVIEDRWSKFNSHEYTSTGNFGGPAEPES